MSCALILFAKAPRLGGVKTRLETALSAKRVRRLYVAFVMDTLAMARRVRGVQRRVIAFTPSNGEQLLRRAIGRQASGFEFLPQQGDDLGERMRRAFWESFQHGAKRTVIIGTDSPTLPARLVEEAFAALLRDDVVLGPSTDGGYCLIGANRDRSAVIHRVHRDIAWSTERVFEQTIAAARRARLKVHLLAPWYDVDEASSLPFLKAHLSALAASGVKELPRHTYRALRGL